MQRFGATLSTLLLALVVGSAALTSGAEASTVAEIKERGKLILLCWPHQESYFVRRMIAEYGEEGLNRFGGIDVEIARAYAESLGVDLEIQPMEKSFSQLLPALLAGQGDIVGSSLTITKKRAQRVDFSAPYFSVQKVVIARADESLDSIADLAGLRGAVVSGSSHEEHLQALDVELELVYVDFLLEGYTAVVDNEADFALVDSTSADRVLADNPDLAAELQRAFAFPRDDNYGFAVAPGGDLLASFDAFLEQLQRSGELDQIKKRNLERVR